MVVGVVSLVLALGVLAAFAHPAILRYQARPPPPIWVGNLVGNSDALMNSDIW